MSQLVKVDVNCGNRKAVLTSNYTLQLRIRECHAGMKCDLKGTKHYSHCIWLSHDSKYKSYLTRKPLKLNPLQAACIPGVQQVSIFVKNKPAYAVKIHKLLSQRNSTPLV